MWTDKQWDFIENADKTYNGKMGATRSGKTFLDLKHRIPEMTRELSGLDGLYVIMGVTSDTIERNVLAPMREIWGKQLVGEIKAKSEVILFGETYHVVGHEKISAVKRLQGASIKYCYIDEIVSMNKETFEMLHSRLDKSYSTVDFTGNPDNPGHFIHKWLTDEKRQEDLFLQTYTLDDNEFLEDEVKERVKRQYQGTVNYDRYVLGRWVAAEGAIYPMMTDDLIITEERFKEMARYNKDTKTYDGVFVSIGIDFGGNKSFHTFTCTAINKRYEWITTVIEKKIKGGITPRELDIAFANFVRDVLDKGFLIDDIRHDSAEVVLPRGMQQELDKQGMYYTIKPSIKDTINERIKVYQRLMNMKRYFILDSCPNTIEAFKTAVWSDKTDSEGKDIRLDDGTTDIDSLDSQEYSTTRYHRKLLKE